MVYDAGDYARKVMNMRISFALWIIATLVFLWKIYNKKPVYLEPEDIKKVSMACKGMGPWREIQGIDQTDFKAICGDGTMISVKQLNDKYIIEMEAEAEND